MAIKLTTTKKTSSHIKCLVYAQSGAGKTYLCQTAPKPLIISAEEGLLTLKDVNIPVIKIQSLEDLEEAYDFVTTDKRAKQFQTVCLDSISDIGETVLADEKKTCGADPRKAYGAYADKLLPLIKKFRDISDKHVYFTAKLKRYEDSFTGITSYGPSMPGQQLGPALPYLFDFVLALQIGEDEENNKFRYLQTDETIQFLAKARGGSLDETEPPDLAYIFAKALAANPKQKVVEEENEDEEIDQATADEEDELNQNLAEGTAEEPEESEEVEETEVDSDSMASEAEATMEETE